MKSLLEVVLRTNEVFLRSNEVTLRVNEVALRANEVTVTDRKGDVVLPMKHCNK